MSRATGYPGYSEMLPGLEQSAVGARRLVRTALSAWQLDELNDDGLVLVSELVANAVKHTSSHLIRVVVSRPCDRRVRIGVSDTSTAMPRLHDSNGDNLPTSGRGLLLIEALTDRWGTDLRTWGKHVWGELTMGET
ncbi:ATP-binding protein [Streptomyces sp. NPDC093252]|uniref:ATP-binding protein n=1 Tax=Streptomyces sp. NPDC093252 TaxID=3154980 RepID=UPI003419B327